MIGIDIDMPKNCKECDFKWWDNIADKYRCNYHGICLKKEYDIKRHPNCAIIDLGNKSMSFDELLKKMKDNFSEEKFIIVNDIIWLRDYLIAFRRDGSITCFERKIKPFQAWRIINILIEGEKDEEKNK